MYVNTKYEIGICTSWAYYEYEVQCQIYFSANHSKPSGYYKYPKYNTANFALCQHCTFIGVVPTINIRYFPIQQLFLTWGPWTWMRK